MQALPFPEPLLTDGDVLLRPPRDADALAQSAWGRDEEIVRWTEVPRGNTLAAARAWIAQREPERLAGRSLFLTIAGARSDAVLGACDLRWPGDDPLVGELGYLLGPAARGRGIATRAVRLFAGWALSELGMRRVQALVHPANHSSLAVVERAGLRMEGLIEGYRQNERGAEDRLMLARESRPATAPVGRGRRAEVDRLLIGVRDWAEGRYDIAAVALVGSWARGTPDPGSDLDLVLLADEPGTYTGLDAWAGELGALEVVRTLRWGATTERRLLMHSGLEVDVGVAEPSWARADPIDPGTLRVVRDGLRALYDPRGLLEALQQAAER